MLSANKLVFRLYVNFEIFFYSLGVNVCHKQINHPTHQHWQSSCGWIVHLWDFKTI